MRHYQRMPEELEKAIGDCAGPFKRLVDTHDGTGDKWQSSICGARVACAAIPGGGHRIDARYAED